MDSDAVRSRRYRDRLRGGPPRELLPCGTPAAYRRHERARERPCELCREAEARRHREIYAAAKQRRSQ